MRSSVALRCSLLWCVIAIAWLASCGDDTAAPAWLDVGPGDVIDAASDGSTAEQDSPGETEDASEIGDVDETDLSADADSDARPADVAEPDVHDTPDVDTPDLDEADSDTGLPQRERAEVLVLAGDSWSTGLVNPTRQVLNRRGFDDVAIRFDGTANAGSRAARWAVNDYPPAHGGGVDTSRPRMMDALFTALDASPPADVLVVSLTGNDFNYAIDQGWGEDDRTTQAAVLDSIATDLQTVISAAIDGRPHLRVVLFGYDYLHYEFLVAFGLSLDGLDTTSYNVGLVALGERQRAVADELGPQVIYAHNYGLLQHTFGDTIHPPFSIPNPLTGYPEYDPGQAPRPGGWPNYEPWPGGFVTYPAPLDYMPDGIHPSPTGFEALMANTLDQLPPDWLAGEME